MSAQPISTSDIFRQEWQNTAQVVHSLKAKADAKRTSSEKIADWIASHFGSVTFLVLNFIWFVSWIIVNTGLIPGVKSFDPFPFGLLTTIVSLEAIILAIFVLISQNRAAKIDALREEIDLHVDTIAELEITKIMSLLVTLLKKNHLDVSHDKILQEMLKPAHSEKLEEKLEKEIT